MMRAAAIFYLIVLLTNTYRIYGENICELTPAKSTANFSDVEVAWLKGVTIVSAVLSFLGSFFIVFSYFRFPNLGTLLYRLIVYLSVADLMSSLSYILGPVAEAILSDETYYDSCPGFLCFISAAVTQWFDVATFCWTACIAFNIYMVIVKNKGEEMEGYVKIYNLCSWGVPLLMTVIVGLTGAFGDAGNWCWIKQDYVGTRVLAYYAPLLLIMLYDTVIYTVVVKSVNGTSQRNVIAFRLRLYLLVFLITKAPSIINRAQNIIAPDHPIYVLYLLQSIFAPLMGFFNCMVYGCNSMVLSEWKRTPICGGCCDLGDTENDDAIAMISHDDANI